MTQQWYPTEQEKVLAAQLEEIASKFIQAVKEGRLQLVQSFIENGVLYLAREYEYLVIGEGRIFLTESREDHTLLSYPRIYDLQEASPC